MQTRSSSSSSNKGAPGSATTNEAVPILQRGRQATDSELRVATKTLERRTKCQWSPEEEERLILFLVSKKSEVDDGGSFKTPTWTAAVEEMAKFPTKGPNKTTGACSSKYNRLRSQYNIITTLKGLSGLGSRYTTELGMNIGVAEKSVWDEYTTKHPGAASFAHKGFPLYDLMTPLMPNLAKGANVYQPSQGTYGIASTTLHQPLILDNNASDNLQDQATDLIKENANRTPPASSATSPRPTLPSLLATKPATLSCTDNSYSTTPTSASGSKRKQSALSALQSSSTGKKQRINAGASAMDGIKQSLDDFNATVAKSILVQPERIRPDTSPERRERAVQLLEQEDYLTDDQMIAFFDYFKSDTAAADIYLAISIPRLRKAWVQRQLWKELGFPQEIPK